MLLVSIIDPSKEDVTRLSALIERHFRRSSTAYVQRVYQSGMEFVRSAENSDIVFLETNLEKLDGLETARIIRKLGSEAQLIFVARGAEMAIHGYSVDALDYLLKPVEPTDVERALDKAVRRLSSRSCAYLALKLPNGTASISTNDITYVEVFDHNLVYHTTGGDYTVRGRLGDVYEQLDHDYFLACNRSFIVNLRYVTEICTDHVILNGTKISVSKSHRKEIQSRFSAFMDKRAEKV